MAKAPLKTLLKKYENRLLSTKRIALSTISTAVIEESPVLSGSYRASWNPNNGPPQIKNVTIDGGNPRPARNEVTATINRLAIDEPYSLVNGQPYGPRIEYEGWSAKAPDGTLNIAVAQWDQFVREAANIAKSRI